MHLETNHDCTQQEAVARIDALWEKLLLNPLPGGIEVHVVDRHWKDNLMEFSFTAGKGTFSASVRGKILVTDGLVVLDSELPSIVTALVGEEGVKALLARKLKETLNNES
ncbi:MAG TPA: hypothetical protein VMW38_22120 [Terriglobia bacterium]|nr:hypothetical protein [Terriglobia bacterium]